MKKKGISLIVLTVTLIVMSILAFVITISIKDSTKSAKITAFAEELREIRGESQAYYLKNGKYPVLSDKSYTQADLLSISRDSAELQNEITLNNDNSSTYYKVDLDEISKSGGIYGTGQNEYDFYVLSADGRYIYYPRGIKIGDTVYFSVTNKMSSINRIDLNLPDDTDVNSVKSAEGITVTRDKIYWTNELSLTVNTTVNSNEKLYYSIGSVKTQITSSFPYTVKLNASFAQNNSALSEALANGNGIIFTKEDTSGKIIAKTNIDISNLDITKPSVGTPVVEKYSDYTLISFTDASDGGGSGIDSSFYVTSSNTYSASSIISSGMAGQPYSIKVDKSVTYVQYVIVDKAGNVSSVEKVNVN